MSSHESFFKRTSKKSDETNVIEETFKFERLGRFHFFFLLALIFILLQEGWLDISINFFYINTYACISPENITDPCSMECKKAEFDKSIIKNNFIMEFNWTCEREIYVEHMYLINTVGYFFGAVISIVLKNR